jgi:hypothetical protein
VTFTDAELAHYLAEETGKRLLAVRERLYNDGASPWYAKDVGDAAAQRFLDEALAEHRPNDAVLSEEAADDSNRMTADRVWIIDPLDGTQEYSEFDRADWAVHIALWERKDAQGLPSNEGTLTAGAVSLPAFGMVLDTNACGFTQPRNRCGNCCGPSIELRSCATGFGGGQSNVGGAGRNRHLRARRRHAPVGLGRAGGCCRGSGPIYKPY